VYGTKSYEWSYAGAHSETSGIVVGPGAAKRGDRMEPAGLIEEVVAGALVEVIAATGRRLGTAVAGRRSRGGRRDLEIARWFDTYRLAPTSFEPSRLPAGVTAQALGNVLCGDGFQSVLHELLAVRLTDAPESEAARVRLTAELILGAAFPGTDTSRLAAALFDHYDNEIGTLVGRLQGAQPDLLPQIRDEAFSARIIATLHAIERHTEALSARPGPATDEEFLTRYRRHLIEHHGRIDPPDFERRRRIPIAELYVPPTITQADARRDWPHHEVDFEWFDSEIDRTVLLGDPGGGKTTAAHVLLHRHAAGSAAEPGARSLAKRQTRTPFLVVLREFAARTPPERSVVGFIEHKLETFYQCPPPPGLVARLLLSGSALVIFDGLDELVDTSRRGEVTAIVERFCTEYPLARVLVTSRVVGYDQARLDDRQFVRYSIGSFNDEQVRAYVRKWFAQEEGIDTGSWTQSFMDESAAVPDLRSNPLMLALMCILYRGEGSIPRNRPEVYEQCANLLFHKWDARRSIHVELRARHLVEPTLRHLAHWLFERDEAQPAVTERELLRKASDFLYERGFETTDEAREAARELVDFCRGRMWVFSDAGTTAEGEALFTFTHRTFREYFAAAHLAVTSDTPEQLARKLAPPVAKQEWEVVAELAAQMKNRSSDRGAERLFDTLLGDRRRRSVNGRGNILEFLARCLKSMDPPPRVIRELTRAILGHLFAGDPDAVECYKPLGRLIECSITCKEVVRDEIATQVSAMIESPEATTRLNGLRLAAWVWLGSSVLVESILPDNKLRDFWRDFGGETLRKYRFAAVEAAQDDSSLRVACLDHRLITLEQALAMKGGPSALLRFYDTAMFGVRFGPYLAMRVHDLAQGHRNVFDVSGSGSADLIAEFEVVGRHFAADEPPWPVDSLMFYGTIGANPKSKQSPSPDDLGNPFAYLGAAVTLFIFAEADMEKGTEGLQQGLGTLAGVSPYIIKRWTGETGVGLPDLPVPERFLPLLRKWANREVDFARVAEEPWA